MTAKTRKQGMYVQQQQQYGAPRGWDQLPNIQNLARMPPSPALHQQLQYIRSQNGIQWDLEPLVASPSPFGDGGAFPSPPPVFPPSSPPNSHTRVRARRTPLQPSLTAQHCFELFGMVNWRHGTGTIYKTPVRIMLPANYPQRPPLVYLAPPPEVSYNPRSQRMEKMVVAQGLFDNKRAPRAVPVHGGLVQFIYDDPGSYSPQGASLDMLLACLKSSFESTTPMEMAPCDQAGRLLQQQGPVQQPATAFGAGGAAVPPSGMGGGLLPGGMPPGVPGGVPGGSGVGGGGGSEQQLRARLASVLLAQLREMYQDTARNIDEAEKRGREAEAASELLDAKLQRVAALEVEAQERKAEQERHCAAVEAWRQEQAAAPAPKNSLECIAFAAGSSSEEILAFKAECEALLDEVDSLEECHKKKVVSTADFVLRVREAHKRAFISKEMLTRLNKELDSRTPSSGVRAAWGLVGGGGGGGGGTMEH